MTPATELNKEYLDLYGESILPFIEMPATSTFDDIKQQVDKNATVGYQHKIKIAGRCIIAERRFTWKGNTAKTSYLHILRVNNFEECKIIAHWREQKNGNFKTI